MKWEYHFHSVGLERVDRDIEEALKGGTRRLGPCDSLRVSISSLRFKTLGIVERVNAR
jgi:hypothetical protein